MDSLRVRKEPALQPQLLSIPFPDFPDSESYLPDSIEEHPEYDSADLNLGAESPGSVLVEVADKSGVDDQWAKSGIAVHTNVPTRDRTWRSSSFSRKRGRDRKKELVDRDCGICFEVAVKPCTTICCGKLFCLEHITDWLQGSSSDGRCPSCEAACSLESDTLLLASPTLNLRNPDQTPTSYAPKSYKPIPSPLRMSSPWTSSTESVTVDRPHPDLSPMSLSLSSDTVEILSRLASIVGLTLFLYALFA